MLEPVLIIIRIRVKDQYGFPAAPGAQRMFLNLGFPGGDMTGLSPPSMHLGILLSNGSVQIWHGFTSSDAL
jgi:hypothetical protein